MLTKEQLDAFMQLAAALSPENLSCDGMLPRSVVRRKWAMLLGRWAKLEKQVGRKVTEKEVWDQYMQSRKAA